jgi:spore germination cell wall hydrolase CwlJ-like protein
MTAAAFTISRCRVHATRPRIARGAAALLLAAAVIGSAVLLIPLGERSDSAAAGTMPKERAAALMMATSGPAASEMKAVGEQARIINASLPFAGGPLRAAAPFAISGSDVDQRRALLCLTQAVYYEAGFEPLDGRRAVAQVVLNRLRHPAFPKSVCGVVYQGAGTGTCQFTFVCDGALYRKPANYAWLEAETIARAALAGYVDRSVGEATHYHADYVAPRWAPLLAKVAQIGQHIFYRWPGSWGQPSAFTGRYIGEPRDPLALRPPLALMAPATAAPGLIADAGPPVPRASNDVGGLLDTSKGWTLHIPGPDESDSNAAHMIAAQGGKPVSPPQVAAADAMPAAGGR